MPCLHPIAEHSITEHSITEHSITEQSITERSITAAGTTTADNTAADTTRSPSAPVAHARLASGPLVVTHPTARNSSMLRPTVLPASVLSGSMQPASMRHVSVPGVATQGPSGHGGSRSPSTEGTALGHHVSRALFHVPCFTSAAPLVPYLGSPPIGRHLLVPVGCATPDPHARSSTPGAPFDALPATPGHYRTARLVGERPARQAPTQRPCREGRGLLGPTILPAAESSGFEP
ncbi:MAG: hypothetical protein R2706_06815 [Acidimicrobiales bacterium]